MKQFMSRCASLCYMPRCKPGADLAHEDAARHAEGTDDQYANDNVRVILQRVGFPGVVADAELTGNHFRGHQTEPGGSHADRETCDDVRQGAGDNHLPQNCTTPRAEAAR